MDKVTQEEIVEALNALACLGNGNTRGNSIGNDIAGDLLDKIQANGIAPPDGWALVPIEPTEEILNAVLSITTDCHSAAESYGDILKVAAKDSQ